MTATFQNIDDAIQLCRDIRNVPPPVMEELGRLSAVLLRQAEAVNRLVTCTDTEEMCRIVLQLSFTNVEVREIDTDLFTMLGVQN